MTTLKQIYKDLNLLETQVRSHDEFESRDDMVGSITVLKKFIENKQTKAIPAGADIALNVLKRLQENIRFFSKEVASTDVEKKLATDVDGELSELANILKP